MKAANTECPACKANPGEPCHDIGYGDEPRNTQGFHVSRARRAHYQTLAERHDVRVATKRMKERGE